MTRTFHFGPNQAAKFRWLVGLAIAALAWTTAMPALAAAPGDNEIDWFRLGLVFFGMGVMSQSMNPLRSYQPLAKRVAKDILPKELSGKA